MQEGQSIDKDSPTTSDLINGCRPFNECQIIAHGDVSEGGGGVEECRASTRDSGQMARGVRRIVDEARVIDE
jgi:hypothetical protein